MDESPELISKFDQVLEQLHLLFRDIEEFKMDAGVVVMLRNGALDVRGLGEVMTIEQAAAVLHGAKQSLPPVSQLGMLGALTGLMERSRTIEAEHKLWRPATNLHQRPANPME